MDILPANRTILLAIERTILLAPLKDTGRTWSLSEQRERRRAEYTDSKLQMVNRKVAKNELVAKLVNKARAHALDLTEIFVQPRQTDFGSARLSDGLT